MAVQFLPSAPGTRPYPTSPAEIVSGIANAVSRYQQGRRQRLIEALNRLLLRGELTGAFGQPSPLEQQALGELVGVEDITQVPPTALGRKARSAKQVSEQLQGMSRLGLSLLGIKVPSPVDDFKKLEEIENIRARMEERAGTTGRIPSPAYRQAAEQLTGQPWPTDPLTGQPVPYLSADRLREQRRQQQQEQIGTLAIQRAIEEASLFDETYEQRKYAEQTMDKLMRFGWQVRYPQLYDQFEQALAELAARSSSDTTAPISKAAYRSLPDDTLKQLAWSDPAALRELERRYPDVFRKARAILSGR